MAAEVAAAVAGAECRGTLVSCCIKLLKQTKTQNTKGLLENGQDIFCLVQPCYLVAHQHGNH